MLIQDELLNNKTNQDILNLLVWLKERSIIRSIDYHFSLFLNKITQDPIVTFVAVLVSHALGEGHVCLDLLSFNTENALNTEVITFFGLNQKEHNKILSYFNLPVCSWIAHLKTCSEVSDGTKLTPLVLHNNYVYLYCHWCDETTILNQLAKQRIISPQAIELCAEIIDQLFPKIQANQHEIDWQKMAVALATITNFCVISGGPGTGKTTTVMRLMALLIELEHQQKKVLNIKLVAPTGKAAARLSESIRMASETANLPDKIEQLIPKETSTIHRLLGVLQGKNSYKFNKENRLHLDVLIVDEASMIDQTLMASLIQALPDHAKLILLGDKNQLASVEAGSVFGDICRFYTGLYDETVSNLIKNITGQRLPVIKQGQNIKHNHASGLHNHVCHLQKSYRFNPSSGISNFSIAVKDGNIQTVNTILGRSFSDLKFYTYPFKDDLIATIKTGYQNYFDAINANKNPYHIHEIFSEFQILCAVRESAFGLQELNKAVHTMFFEAQKIPNRVDVWYPGRPIMITENSPALSLYNGDIGIALKEENKIRVVFIMPDGTLKKLTPMQLPKHETSYAMTVHKSQGSEFKNVTLVLPDHPSPVLNRALLYTAITRARKNMSIFGDLFLIQKAIQNNTNRVSGLEIRIKQNVMLSPC